jgi:hypothetical protein
MKTDFPQVTRTPSRMPMATPFVHFYRLLLLNLAVAQILFLVIGAFIHTNAAGIPQKEYPHDFEAVWTATIGVLQEHGDPIIHSDKASGVITTDYKAEEGAWRHKFNLLLVKKGEAVTNVSVTCTVEKMSKSAFVGKYGKWEDKKSDDRRETQLLEAIAQRLQSGSSTTVTPQKEYPKDFEAVWTAAIGVLQEHGDPIINSDKTNGIITTDFKADEDAWHHKFSLLLVRKGETNTNVSVTCIVEKMSKSAFAGKYGKWEDKKSDGKRESQLLSDIGQRLQSQSQVTK